MSENITHGLCSSIKGRYDVKRTYCDGIVVEVLRTFARDHDNCYFISLESFVEGKSCGFSCITLPPTIFDAVAKYWGYEPTKEALQKRIEFYEQQRNV